MPIDPVIAYGIRPPQVESVDDAQARILTLKNLAQQNRMGEIGVRNAEMEQATRAQAMADETAMREALASYDPANPNAAVQSLMQRGLHKQASALQQSIQDRQKAQVDIDEKGFKLGKERLQAVQSGLTAILNLPPEMRQPYYSAKLADWLKLKWISPGQLRDQVPDENTLKAHAFDLMETDKQLDQWRKQAQDKRDAEDHNAQLPGKTAKSLHEQWATAAQTGAPINNQDDWTRWLSTQTPEIQKALPPMWSPGVSDFLRRKGMTADQQVTAEQTGKRDAATVAHQKEMESQGRAHIQIERTRLAHESDPKLVQAVIDNPTLYDGLTPSARTAIAPELARAGFSAFGKPLAESAITKMSDSRSAIASLKDLRQTLQENEQYIGPISGLQVINPYSDARKAQAKIDLVKQRVGKALEGGVLRKEDEDKYKKILATLQDTPSTAIAKVDGVIQSLERDLDTFIEEQRRAGRKVNTTGSGAGKGSGGRPPLSAFEGK